MSNLSENPSDIHVIWKDRGYPFDQFWASEFARKGFNVTESTEETDAGAYILLQGVTAGFDHVMKDLWWLEEKQGKKLALVINAHKLQDKRKKFFEICGITAGMEFDGKDLYPDSIWVPSAFNHRVFTEDIKRKDRASLVGFRGHPYKRINTAIRERASIVEPFQKYPEVKVGEFIWEAYEWCHFLNTIKAIPSVDGFYNGHFYLLSRHFEAAGTKTVNVMYQNRNGIFDDDNYIKLERDHSNLKEVEEMLRDEAHCEKIASRTQEKVLDAHTIKHRVDQIVGWIDASA